MRKEIDYENDIEIDENALDIECLDQPKLMLKYSRNAAEKERERDNAKDALNLIRSELDGKIRSKPEKYKLEKITEAAVSAIITQQEAYKEAYQAFVDAQFEYNIANNAVKAFEQRKSMLETLVKLHGQSYFAGPNVPRDIHREREVKSQKANSAVSIGMKRNKIQ